MTRGVFRILQGGMASAQSASL